jgi:hypothetical protein
MSNAAATRGVVFVHSCSRALTSHVEWGLSGVLGGKVELSWQSQPCEPGQVRADMTWVGPVGTAARIVSMLRSWPGLRLEVTEEPSAHHPGERYAITPGLGLFRAEVGPHGDIMLGEDRLRSLMAQTLQAPVPLEHLLREALGEPWDLELEPFRASIGEVGARHLQVI